MVNLQFIVEIIVLLFMSLYARTNTVGYKRYYEEGIRKKAAKEPKEINTYIVIVVETGIVFSHIFLKFCSWETVFSYSLFLLV